MTPISSPGPEAVRLGLSRAACLPVLQLTDGLAWGFSACLPNKSPLVSLLLVLTPLENSKTISIDYEKNPPDTRLLVPEALRTSTETNGRHRVRVRSTRGASKKAQRLRIPWTQASGERGPREQAAASAFPTPGHKEPTIAGPGGLVLQAPLHLESCVCLFRKILVGKVQELSWAGCCGWLNKTADCSNTSLRLQPAHLYWPN